MARYIQANKVKIEELFVYPQLLDLPAFLIQGIHFIIG